MKIKMFGTWYIGQIIWLYCVHVEYVTMNSTIRYNYNATIKIWEKRKNETIPYIKKFKCLDSTRVKNVSPSLNLMYSSYITSSFLKAHITLGNFCIQRNIETGCEFK